MGEQLPRPAPGEYLHLRVVPEPREGLPTPDFIGSTRATGASYLFLFPFDIYVASDLTEVQSSFVDQLTPNRTEIRLYPPFLNTGTGEHFIEQIELSAVPSPPGVVAPDHNKVRMKSWGLSREFGRPANAMRIDLFPDREATFANIIMNQFLGLARWWTLQWWIKRDRRHSEAYLRNWFAINEASERLSGVHAYSSLYGFLGFERPLSLDMFRSIRGNITNGRESPLSRELFLDAVYFHSLGEVRRALLELAISAESAVAEMFTEMALKREVSGSALKKVLRLDFGDRLARGAKQLFGRSFADERPDEHEWVLRAWFSRGNVAHALEPKVKMPDGVRLVNHADVVRMIGAILELFKWLEGLRADARTI
jgi:hypothetical protein